MSELFGASVLGRDLVRDLKDLEKSQVGKETHSSPSPVKISKSFKFPGRIIVRIMIFLEDFFVIRNCVMVSKQWYRTVMEKLSFCFRVVGSKDVITDFDQDLKQFMFSLRSDITSLVIPGSFIADYSKLSKYSNTLTELNVSGCKITKFELVEICKLSRLTKLDISRNLVGGLESIGNLGNLKYLNVSMIGIEKIPNSLFSLSNLTYLDLHGNGCLDGNSLVQIGKLQKLEFLDLTENSLSNQSNLVENIRNLSKLTTLKIGYNNFSISDQCRIVPDNLTCLDISNTFGKTYDGSMFSKSSWLTKIVELSIEGCGVDTFIEQLAKNMVSLTNLNARGSNMTTKGAAYLSTMKKLTCLKIGHNQIGSPGAKHISNLKQLTELDISSCGIRNIGLEYICTLSSLNSLDLRDNEIDLNGFRKIIDSLKKLKKLTTLQMMDSIGDKEVKILSELTQLTALNVSYNCIGNIGASYISKMKNMTTLRIDKNFNLTGKALTYLSSMKNLKVLSITRNQEMSKKAIDRISNMKLSRLYFREYSEMCSAFTDPRPDYYSFYYPKYDPLM